MITDILVWSIPAIAMILFVQFIRNNFIKTDNNKPMICNGERWLFILIALTPIFNIFLLIIGISYIYISYSMNDIKFKNNNSKKLNCFIDWWKK